MKTELILDEMKKAIKRLEKDNKLKTIICIGAGLAVVIVGIVFLVVKMKDKNQNQLPCDYDDGWDAWDEDDYADYEDYDDDDYSYDDADKVVPLADIVLLGPQMRMKLRECQAKFGNQGIPFMVIDIKDYGRMNGANVLKAALAELENKK